MKTRFAPSPTGLMHLGNVRTALFNYLYATELGGEFLLRIEDTDKERSKSEYVDSICEDLAWLGIKHQEKLEFQSTRIDIYATYYADLIDRGLAYQCFCSEAQLKMVRKAQMSAGQPPRYSGTCRNLSTAEIEQKLASGIKPALRLRVPLDVNLTFTDLIKGEVKFEAKDIGDFIIQKQDGSAAFMFANAIDDSLMGVTHALRGEDHLTNTPRQLLILQLLKLREPHYGHFPLILGQDGAPLSKRNGSRNIQDMRVAGFFPDALNNYLARLGHSYGCEDFYPLAELGQKFSLDNISKSPARHDPLQMQHWQQQALMQQDISSVIASFPAKVAELVPAAKLEQFAKVIIPNISFPQDALVWAENLYGKPNFAEYSEVLKDAGAEFFQTAHNLAEETKLEYKKFSKDLGAATETRGKKLFMPLRVALTANTAGPELKDIVELLGQALLQERFAMLAAMLEKNNNVKNI